MNSKLTMLLLGLWLINFPSQSSLFSPDYLFENSYFQISILTHQAVDKNKILQQQSILVQLKNKQFKQVKKQALEKLIDTPNNPGYLVLLGYAEAGMANWSAALYSINKAIKFAPQKLQHNFKVDLANIYSLKGDLDKAKKTYQIVLLEQEENTRALSGLLSIYKKTDDTLSANSILKKLFTLEPKLQDTTQAIINQYVISEDYQQARKMAREYQLLAPQQSFGYLIEGITWLRQNQPDCNGAVKYLEQANRLSTKNSNAHYLLAVAYFCQGEMDLAFNQTQQAIVLSDDFIDAYKVAAIIKIKQRDLPSAMTQLKKAMTIDTREDIQVLYEKVSIKMSQS